MASPKRGQEELNDLEDGEIPEPRSNKSAKYTHLEWSDVPSATNHDDLPFIRNPDPFGSRSRLFCCSVLDAQRFLTSQSSVSPGQLASNQALLSFLRDMKGNDEDDGRKMHDSSHRVEVTTFKTLQKSNDGNNKVETATDPSTKLPLIPTRKWSLSPTSSTCILPDNSTDIQEDMDTNPSRFEYSALTEGQKRNWRYVEIPCLQRMTCSTAAAKHKNSYWTD